MIPIVITMLLQYHHHLTSREVFVTTQIVLYREMKCIMSLIQSDL